LSKKKRRGLLKQEIEQAFMAFEEKKGRLKGNAALTQVTEEGTRDGDKYDSSQRRTSWIASKN